MVWKDKTVIMNSTPLFNENGISGVVTSFRDKTEIEQMLNIISEVKQYSKDHRAQTHLLQLYRGIYIPLTFTILLLQ
jgi:two-component system, CitB family, sensor histidine kinase CitS